MSAIPVPLAIAGVVVLLVAVGLALLHNRLVRLRVRVDEAWAQVATELQRRHDLVPNLVATVQAYAAHEREALDAVTAARARALSTRAPGPRATAEDELGAAIGQLLAVTEAYPTLRADERFRHLQDELADAEDRLAFARGFANDRVARYREAIGSFPGVLLARPLGFGDRPMFDAEEAAASAPALDLTPPDLDRS